MSDEVLMQVGRVVLVNYGPVKGKLAVVVDMLDEGRMLIDGPTTGVDRQIMPTKRLSLTKYRVKSVLRNQKQSVIRKNLESFELEKRWNESTRGKRMTSEKRRMANNDFDRFRALVLRRKLAKEVRSWVSKNKSRINK